MNKLEIKIGVGLSNIHFGASRTDLEKMAGKPNEIDLYEASEDEDTYMSETWHYDDDEFSVCFDEEDGWRLTTISTSSENVIILGEKLIGLSLPEVTEFLKNKDLGEYEVDEISDDDIKMQVLSYIESSINFWFTDGELSEIQWGVLWKDEDTPAWPS